ncbi:Cyanovirin-N [Phlebopus sp. FC_14]|nr:Cyanovirin-N [Phlebopus sp. FC_14]
MHLLASTLLTLPFLKLVAAASGFADTCSNYGVSGTTLSADCLQIDQATDSTSLNLDICLVNSNGELLCRSGGDYGASCSGCHLSGTTFTCSCNNDAHQPVTTSYNLNNCIGNNNGVLVC